MVPGVLKITRLSYRDSTCLPVLICNVRLLKIVPQKYCYCVMNCIVDRRVDVIVEISPTLYTICLDVNSLLVRMKIYAVIKLVARFMTQYFMTK